MAYRPKPGAWRSSIATDAAVSLCNRIYAIEKEGELPLNTDEHRAKRLAPLLARLSTASPSILTVPLRPGR